MRLTVTITLLFLSALALAKSSNGVLVLRGRVPASTSVEWDKADPNNPKVKFRGSKAKPNVQVTQEKDHRKITISHP